MKIVVVRASLAVAAVLFSPSFLQGQPYTIATLAGSNNVPGYVDGTNAAARLNAPAGLALASPGKVYFADPNAVRCLSLSGSNNWIVTTLAGSVQSHGPEDGTNSDARFDNPQGVAVLASSEIYVADTLNDAIRKVALSGTNWIVTTIAGVGGRLGFGSADGSNTIARFYHPYGICADQAGNLYVADTYNHTIRRMTLFGTNWITATIAGFAGISNTNDGVGTNAFFSSPVALTADARTNVYVADYGNHTVRKLTFNGSVWTVSTFAGCPQVSGSADGVGSAARFFRPKGITSDSWGNLYVADFGNYTLRRITASGAVTTIAGSPGNTGSVDGIGNAARFGGPSGIASDGIGTLFISDPANAIIRAGIVAPLLQASKAAGNLVLSWPLGLTNYFPQLAATPRGGSWSTLTNGIATLPGWYVLTNQIQAGPAFYRLHRE